MVVSFPGKPITTQITTVHFKTLQVECYVAVINALLGSRLSYYLSSLRLSISKCIGSKVQTGP